MNENEEAARILEFALHKLRAEGWVQNSGGTFGTGPHCLSTAVYRAATELNRNVHRAGYLAACQVTSTIIEQFPEHGGIVDFNDGPETRFADVGTVLEKAIVRLRERVA